MVGDNPEVLLIPNAVDYMDKLERKSSVENELKRLKESGINAKVLELYEYINNKESLKRILSGADIVWVRGGNTFALNRALQATGADEILRELIIDEKLVYGGHSAGIVILQKSIEGIELVDDSLPADNGSGQYKLKDKNKGLGVIDFSIAPHYKSDHFDSDRVMKLVAYYKANNVNFITLKDGEVLLIDGVSREVLR